MNLIDKSKMSIAVGAERRKFGRKEANIEALANIPGRAAVGCVIKNISQMGALLEIPAPFSPRGNFRLYVERRLDVMCQIRRQEGSSFGVEFVAITVHELAPALSEAAGRTPVYEGSQKRELVASSGFEMRQRLFGRVPDGGIHTRACFRRAFIHSPAEARNVKCNRRPGLEVHLQPTTCPRSSKRQPMLRRYHRRQLLRT